MDMEYSARTSAFPGRVQFHALRIIGRQIRHSNLNPRRFDAWPRCPACRLAVDIFPSEANAAADETNSANPSAGAPREEARSAAAAGFLIEPSGGELRRRVPLSSVSDANCRSFRQLRCCGGVVLAGATASPYSSPAAGQIIERSHVLPQSAASCLQSATGCLYCGNSHTAIFSEGYPSCAH